MTKVLKKIKVPKTDAVIFKRDRSKYYNITFYVGRHLRKSGNYQKSLKLTKERDALKKAQEIYKKFWIENDIQDTQEIRQIKKEYKFDNIAMPYLEQRLNDYKRKMNTTGLRDYNKYKNELRQFFKDIDIRETDKINRTIIESLQFLKEKNLSNGTVRKYKNVISLICNNAHERGLMNYKPAFPKIPHLPTERPPYDPKEVKVLAEYSRQKKIETSDEFYDDLSDFIYFCRSAPVRPGREVLEIKIKDINLINHIDFKDEKIMAVNIRKTKTKKHQVAPVHPEFYKQIYENRILKRRPKIQESEYLFFPQELNRERLFNRVSKSFSRISQECELYIKNEKERPLYSLRHTHLVDRFNKGTATDLIAMLGNTSTEMLEKHYIQPHSKEVIIKNHSRYFADYYSKKK